MKRSLSIYIYAINIDLIFLKQGNYIMHIRMIDCMKQKIITDLLYLSYHLNNL